MTYVVFDLDGVLAEPAGAPLAELTLVEGIAETFAALKARGQSVAILTTRPRQEVEALRDWLAAQQVPHDLLVRTDDPLAALGSFQPPRYYCADPDRLHAAQGLVGQLYRPATEALASSPGIPYQALRDTIGDLPPVAQTAAAQAGLLPLVGLRQLQAHLRRLDQQPRSVLTRAEVLQGALLEYLAGGRTDAQGVPLLVRVVWEALALLATDALIGGGRWPASLDDRPRPGGRLLLEG